MRTRTATSILPLSCILWLGAVSLRAQEIVAEPNLQLFTVFAALNAAGYDVGNNTGEMVPLRAAILKELSGRTIPSLPVIKDFYQEHRASDPSRDLSQYISLALFLSDPPKFELEQSPVNLPPDVLDLRDMIPLLSAFYQQAGVAALWDKYSPAIEKDSERYQRLLTRLLQETNGYLRMDTSGYWNRRFAVYLNPLGPKQTDARSYGDSYSIVVGPSEEMPEEEIQHGWLHYLLDPYPLKYPKIVESKSELQKIAQRAPALDSTVRESFSLLLTESLIRAVQARRSRGTAEKKRKAVQDAVEEGFFLTAYFYSALEDFEKQPVGMRLYYPDMIDAISVPQEQRRLAETRFRAAALTQRRETQWSDLELRTREAELNLARGQYEPARAMFESLLNQYGPQARVVYGLAIIATQQRQPEIAKQYFTQAASLSAVPRTRAWSHIYLGRLLDLEGNRPAAMAEYAAALEAGDSSPETKSAAEKGLRESFSPAGNGETSQPGSPPNPADDKPRNRVPLGKPDAGALIQPKGMQRAS